MEYNIARYQKGGKMTFYNDPVKSKRVFIIFLVLSIVFFLGCGVLGYLYYREHSNKNSDTQSLTNQINDLKKQNDALKTASSNLDAIVKENQTLKTNNTSLEKENVDFGEGIAKANIYNDFFKYLNSVIENHSGFTGWTDAEFEHAKSIAEKTGDTGFVSDVNWAWYQTTVTPDERIMRIWNDISAGIENSLK